MVFICLLLIIFSNADAQTCNLRFAAVFGHEILTLEKPYASASDTVSISTLKCYISNITLLHKGTPVFKDAELHHLLNFEELSTLSFSFQLRNDLDFDAISFEVGIDSATNYQGALGGDLDPTKGMYWTWQNGYINFKIEGSSRKSPAPNHAFEFHVGGYSAPYNTLQTISLPVSRRREIVINVDVEKLLAKIELQRTHHVMLPGKDAKTISAVIGNIFSVQDP
jgi:hypothetical protein